MKPSMRELLSRGEDILGKTFFFSGCKPDGSEHVKVIACSNETTFGCNQPYPVCTIGCAEFVLADCNGKPLIKIRPCDPITLDLFLLKAVEKPTEPFTLKGLQASNERRETCIRCGDRLKKIAYLGAVVNPYCPKCEPELLKLEQTNDRSKNDIPKLPG